NLVGVSYEDFCTRVQGFYDRQTIAGSFQVAAGVRRTPEFDLQLGWLREWVLSPETPMNFVYNLLQFATGSRSLQPGANINVTTQYNANRFTPFPAGHTCFNTIDLCPNFLPFGNQTKEEFFETLNQGLERI